MIAKDVTATAQGGRLAVSLVLGVEFGQVGRSWQYVVVARHERRAVHEMCDRLTNNAVVVLAAMDEFDAATFLAAIRLAERRQSGLRGRVVIPDDDFKTKVDLNRIFCSFVYAHAIPSGEVLRPETTENFVHGIDSLVRAKNHRDVASRRRFGGRERAIDGTVANRSQKRIRFNESSLWHRG